MSAKLKMGMIGGGIGSFIGDVHRKSAVMDGMVELVCGAFSSTEEKSIHSGRELGLAVDRCYGDYQTMIQKEKELPVEQRMDFVSIVTPNHMHFGPAKLALESGFHVICDKPLSLTLDQAKELERIVLKSGKLFALTHNYTGYPMVKQARAMVENGDLGTIRKVQVQYLQGWLATNLEETGHKQALWRVDPKVSGIGGGLGDIGTHAANLIEFITGLRIEELSADLGIFGKGRVLDDDGNLLLRLENGAKGTLSFSQIAVGEENNLGIKVYGEKGSLEWYQESPNTLEAKFLSSPKVTYTPNGNDLYPQAQTSRIPAGHPEGYLEAFATIYKNFSHDVLAYLENPDKAIADYPTVEDGVQGMRFIYAAVESNRRNSAWVKLEDC